MIFLNTKDISAHFINENKIGLLSFTLNPSYMLFTTLLIAAICYQIYSVFGDDETQWYEDPKFWINILLVFTLTAITFV